MRQLQNTFLIAGTLFVASHYVTGNANIFLLVEEELVVPGGAAKHLIEHINGYPNNFNILNGTRGGLRSPIISN